MLNECFYSTVLLSLHECEILWFNCHLFSEARFVDNHSAELIQRVSVVMPIADALMSAGIIHNETYSKIRAASPNQDKMRELLDALNTDKAKSTFYDLLKKKDSFLVKDLEHGERN